MIKEFKFPDRSDLIFLGHGADEVLVTQSGVAQLSVHHWENELPVLEDGTVGVLVTKISRSVDEILSLLHSVHKEEEALHMKLKQVLEEKAQYLKELEALGIHVTDKFFEDI